MKYVISNNDANKIIDKIIINVYGSPLEPIKVDYELFTIQGLAPEEQEIFVSVSDSRTGDSTAFFYDTEAFNKLKEFFVVNNRELIELLVPYVEEKLNTKIKISRFSK